MAKARQILVLRSLCFVMVVLVGLLSRGDELFPVSIFEARPPHVRVSESGESAVNPRGSRHFDIFTAPPSIPSQNDVLLTDADLLTLVYPASAGSTVSGGESIFDRVRVFGLQVELDVFYFYNVFGPVGQAIVAPKENSIFIGLLAPGTYDVNVHKWYLPFATASNFEPDAFQPPANFITATSSLFGLPIYPDDPSVVSDSTFQFTVTAVPECGSIAMAFCGAVGLAGLGGRCRSRFGKSQL